MKKVLLICPYYKPVKSAAAKRLSKLARFISESQDFEVSVLTGFGSYPTGIVPQEYRGKLWLKEKDPDLPKVTIYRVYEYPTFNAGLFKRLLNYTSFAFSALLAVTFLRRFDIVLVSSPNFFAGIAGLWAKLTLNSRFIFDVRDLWPDSIIDLNLVKQKLFINLAQSLERAYYKRADLITVVTPSIKDHLVNEKVAENKIKVLVNSVDTDFFYPREVSRQEYDFKKTDFILTYTGTHSQIQALDLFVTALAKLKKYPEIKLLLVGEGETKPMLKKLARKLKVEKQINFMEEKPAEEIAKILAMADAGIISLTNIPIFQEAFPIKSFEYFASGLPVLALISGKMKEYIEKYQTGLVLKNDQAETIAQAILELYQKPTLRKKMGQNARRLALAKFSDKNFANTLKKLF